MIDNIVKDLVMKYNNSLAVLLIALFCTFGVSDILAQTKYKEVDDISCIEPNDTSAYRQERCKLDFTIRQMQRNHSRRLCGFMAVV